MDGKGVNEELERVGMRSRLLQIIREMKKNWVELSLIYTAAYGKADKLKLHFFHKIDTVAQRQLKVTCLVALC